VSGLQGAMSAYILMSGDDEDRFRFAHDRYMQAASKTSLSSVMTFANCDVLATSFSK